jgi:transcriptional regulator with XRE-family HTH domain
MGNKTIPEAFGDVLRDCRTRAGITQENLAFRAELDRTYVSLLERGLRQPTLETLFRLAAVLEIAPTTLITRMIGRMEGHS